MEFKNQQLTPLFSAMKKYIADKAKAFHTPGHKQGLGANDGLKEMITDTGLKMEVSLMDELDDIHGASSCIKEAQELAAQLYKARATRFFINGTTGAIHAMLLTALNPGDTVIVPRNAHRSVQGALTLTGARPVFIQPEIDAEWGIAMSITPQAVTEAIARHPEAKALIMVYPTYYGVAGDLQQIADIVHHHNMLLLVDEAHGPHLMFSDKLPPQALAGDADIVAQSTHKILGSMTQTSLLHMQGERVDYERFNRMSSLVQSTSPNYLLLASLDLARQQMAINGKRLLNQACILADKLRQQVNNIDGLRCLGEDAMNTPGKCALDITKLTVSVRELGITGHEAEQILRHQYKVQCELSDMYNLLFIISYADTPRECEYLYRALQGLARQFVKQQKVVSNAIELPGIPPQIYTPREAGFLNSKAVLFEDSIDKVVGELVTFYPPGIPVIYPGERMTPEIWKFIKLQRDSGGNIIGPEDAGLTTIRILEEA